MFFGISVSEASRKVGNTSANVSNAFDVVFGFTKPGHLTINGIFNPCSFTPHFPERPWSEA